MRFGYASQILDIAPTIVAGVVWCTVVDNFASHPKIESLLRAAEERATCRYLATSDIARDPAIAGWRAPNLAAQSSSFVFAL